MEDVPVAEKQMEMMETAWSAWRLEEVKMRWSSDVVVAGAREDRRVGRRLRPASRRCVGE